MRDTQIEGIIEAIELAMDVLEPPFMALPEHGYTAERLAYNRGARDAYRIVVHSLRDMQAAP